MSSTPPPPPGPANTNPELHRELQELKRWRDDAVVKRRLPSGVIKDADLVQIVTHGRRDPRLVRERLSRSSRQFAEEIVDVQLRVGAARPGPGAAPGQDPGGAAPKAGPAPTPQPAAVTPAPLSNGLFVVGPLDAPTADKAAPTEQDLEHQRLNVASRFAITKRVVRAGQIAAVRVSDVPKGLRLRWTADPEAETVTIYRVVSHDDRPPSSPESGRLVIITYDQSTIDIRPPTSAVRYLRVFSNTGPTVEEALEAQPRLVAQAEHVFGLQDVEVHEEGGHVTGQWRELTGSTRVYVYRIPLEKLHLATPGDQQYLQDTGEANLNGFSDKTTVRGRGYHYDFYVEALVDETRQLSEVTSVEVAVSALLNPVTDLAVVKRFGPDGSLTFGLSWTRPDAGEVAIFRTQGGPAAGATSSVHDVMALPQTDLKEADRLRLRVTSVRDGVDEMRDVPAREGWSRVHLTPVTLLNGKARIGETVTQLVIGAPAEPEVVERCDYQLLKFGWPEGAAKVVVASRPRGEPAALPSDGPGLDEIDRETYGRLGGMQFRARLPSQGCAVHLAGVAFQAGDRDFGPPVAADYAGLIRLRYAVEHRNRFFKLDKVVVRLSAEAEPPSIPAFVLVHRDDRLPLHIRDGQPLPVVQDVELVSQPTRQFRPDRLARELSPVGWSASVRGLSGYIRLFVDGLTGSYALLDPPLPSLLLRQR